MMTQDEHLSGAEIKFSIPKERYEEVKTAMCNGSNCCYLIFDRNSGSSSPSHPAFDLLQGQNNNHLPRVDDVGGSIEQELRRPSQQYPPSSFWIEEEQEQIENNCNSIHIDLAKVQEKHWAYRAINEALDDGKSSVEIDSGELIDFVRTTKARYSCDRYR